MPRYHIDVWQDESIWSWAGLANSEEEAEEFARRQLNEDWEQEYETWDDLASDMNGTALLYADKPGIEALIAEVKNLLTHSHRPALEKALQAAESELNKL